MVKILPKRVTSCIKNSHRPSLRVLLKEHHVELVVLRLREEGPYRAIVVVVRLVGALVSSLGTPW